MNKFFAIFFIAIFSLGFAERLSAADDILIVNSQYIVTESKAGTIIRKRTQELTDELRDMVSDLEKYVKDETEKYQQERTLLSPEMQKQREVDINAEVKKRQDALQLKRQRVEEAIQRAYAEIDPTYNAILISVMNDKGAKMILDTRTVLQSDPSLNVSAQVIKQLNKRLPEVTVNVVED